MAIRNIKELIENKGYVINPEDRKIFEEGDLQSFFGFSPTDSIEFIAYDVNDNQLPQLDGSLVRYISLTDENIRDYFLIADGTEFQKFSLPNEYFIDVERLLNEAGYNNGIFKTQVTLINKRAGSEKEFDKLWIQEISPSRLEVRLFPLDKGVKLNGDLKTRYDIFVRGLDFREDTIQAAFQLAEQIQPSDVVSFLSTKYGNNWVSEFKNEFKINDIQSFVTQIHSSFVKSITYEFTNRFSTIGSQQYGQKKLTSPSLNLSKSQIIDVIKNKLVESIQYYLPLRDTKKSTTSISDFQESENSVETIRQTEESDTIISSTSVEMNMINVENNGNPYQERLIEEEKDKLNDNFGGSNQNNIPGDLNPRLDDELPPREEIPSDNNNDVVFYPRIPIGNKPQEAIRGNQPIIQDQSDLVFYDDALGSGQYRFREKITKLEL